VTRSWELNNAWRESAGGTVTIAFPQPAERLSMNDRRHWRAAVSIKSAWRMAAYAAATNANLGQLPPSYMRVTFPVKDNRRRDSDNPAPTCKILADAFVTAGLWPDDTPQWVETLGSRFAKGADVVTVELIPREP
jgi:crossover junction endodeoxyribonuclease RusA